MSNNNVLLQTLINPSLPEPVSWFPQTIGWQVLGLLFLLMMIISMVRYYRQFKKNKYRRVALKSISVLSQQPHALVLEQLNILLKKNAKHAYQDHLVAPLYAEDWLLFLDNTCSKDTFNNELTQKWQSSLYQPFVSSEWTTQQIGVLISYCQCWITYHQINGHEISHHEINQPIKSEQTIGEQHGI